MKSLGFVPMSAKPFHAGHAALINIAAAENDNVTVYVSLSDRDFISGATMEFIWKTYIESTLPQNVNVIYGGSPVRNVYVALGEVEKDYVNSDVPIKCSIYSDVEDIQKNFTQKDLVKTAPSLTEMNLIFKRGVARTSTIDVSGTAMRNAVAEKDYKKFAAGMPANLNAKKIFSMLRKDFLRNG